MRSRAHMRFVDSLDVHAFHAFMNCVYSPTLNKSSAIWCFERGDVIEIHNGITFDFYTGLPHMLGVPSNTLRLVYCGTSTVIT